MNIRNAVPAPQVNVGLRGLMADMERFGVRFEAEDGAGGGAPGQSEEAPQKPAKKPVEKPAAPAAPSGPSEREQQLARDLEALQARLAAFGEADPEEIANLRKMKDEQKAREAEAAKKAKDEEERRLRDAGQFEALRERMAEEHKREMEAARGQVTELDTTVNSLKTQIESLTMGAAFGSSRFLSEETIIGPSKARIIYGAYFDVEGGNLVPYNAPRGSDKRVKIVDARGQPKNFEEAIKEIIEADSDRDRILRPRQKAGSGVVPTQTRPDEKPTEARGLARLRQAIPGIMGNSK